MTVEETDSSNGYFPGKFSVSQTQALHSILNELPATERRIVQLHYWDTRSLTEIGKTLQMEWHEVKAHLKSAHFRLRGLCLQHPAFGGEGSHSKAA